MFKKFCHCLILFAATLFVSAGSAEAQSEPYSVFDTHALQEEIITKAMRSIAVYQLDRYGPTPPPKNWLVGTFFSGMIQAYHATGDEWYLEQAMKWGEQSEWDVHNAVDADDICPGQTYLELYFIKKDPAMYAKLEEKLRPLLDRKTLRPNEVRRSRDEPVPWTGRNVWWWCDALYMAPPVYARLAVATGDEAYLKEMHRLFWDTVDFLYDPEEHLFYRDSNWLPANQNSAKIFWGRGNGWVFAGLARVIEFIPEDDPLRQRYITLFQEMAFRIAELQQDDGLWRSSLNDPKRFDTKETTGSAFFVYGLAKGVNEGWLPRAYFERAIVRGWVGLLGCITPEGRLTHAQLPAFAPTPVRAWDTVDYAVGGTLLAGSEMIAFAKTAMIANVEEGAFKPQLVAADGAWTWFNDERALIHGNSLYVSYVRSDGKSVVGSFALGNDAPAMDTMQESVLSTWAEQDDHNNAALLPLSDGRILATYAMHATRPAFYQRILKPRFGSLPTLSEEREFTVVETRKGLTYQNLVRLSDEDGRIYNFFRGNNYNPAFVTSDDEAESWSPPHQLIQAGEGSNQRPYVKYVSNGIDRIDFFYTDAHPRDHKSNNIYHFYYKGGAFYRTDGKRIRSAEEFAKEPIAPVEGTLVFDGSSDVGRGWIWDLEYDQDGQPYGAFISSPSGDIGSDMRYWIARVIDGEWTTEQVAHAGSNLYLAEQHYAGGIAIDPLSADRLVISTDVHPDTGEPLPGGVYQLFKGTRDENEWTWEQLTFDPVNDQLRPILVRGRPDTLVWFAGRYGTYSDYQCRILVSLGF